MDKNGFDKTLNYPLKQSPSSNKGYLGKYLEMLAERP